MKNFVIATVSVIALLGAANAAEKTSEMKEVTPAHMMGAKKEAHPMHRAHKHHKHHMRHGHMRHGHALAVYVNYPPVNVAAFSACPCEYYQGNQEHAYIYHEGYFWYPHAHAEMLVGYAPHHMHGSYWYPSRMHPHAVYIDQHNMMPHEIYPVPMGAHHGMKHHAHKHHGMKHHGMKHHAPGSEMHKQEMHPMQK